MQQKRTAFFAQHLRLGAKMVPFAGFEMPMQYAGIIEEHRRVRDSVGLFDVSHMGEVEIWGKDALTFVQNMTINDVSTLTKGRVQYSAMCYDDGGIVDDLLVYHMGDHYMLVINAANSAKDIEWLRRHASGEVEIRDRSDDISLLAVQGPLSLATLKQLTSAELESLAYYHWAYGSLADTDMIISRTGYTGELGFELYFSSDVSTGERVWNAIMDAGKPYGIGPTGLGARDTLRLEMGYCLYGHDIDETTNPIEAGLGWIAKIDKGDFIGRECIAGAKRAGVSRKLTGFTLEGKAFPRQGYVIRAGGAEVGKVTSGTYSPILEQGIGLGYVPIAHAKSGSALSLQIRDREIPATVVPLPFIRK
jgi:aminomethyltransferase